MARQRRRRHDGGRDASRSESGERERLRCLLLSPVAPPDPENGDSQYTLDLLRWPPPNVDYVTYTEALERGEIAWGPSVKELSTWLRPWALVPAAARAALHVLRRVGFLLPEPVRWLSTGTSFDLVHVHGLPVRFVGRRPPVVLTDSAGTFWYWTAARGLSPARTDRLLRRERRAARAIGYVHASAHPEAAERLLLFVASGRELIERVGADLGGMEVCPPGVPPPRHAPQSDGRTLLFVGRAFEVKGGPDALEILRRVRATIPDARLLVAGPEDGPEQDGVEWLGLVGRDRLYDEIYPRADLFVYPTRFDCAPLVVQEAIAHGLPVVAPRIFAIPELVRDGETGALFDPGDVESAADVVIELLGDDPRRERMQAACRADYERRLSVAHRNAVLARVYREVVGTTTEA